MEPNGKQKDVEAKAEGLQGHRGFACCVVDEGWKESRTTTLLHHWVLYRGLLRRRHIWVQLRDDPVDESPSTDG